MRDDIFQPPEDLSELDSRLREVDRRLELESSSERRTIIRRLYPVLGAAAVLGLATGLYFYTQPNVTRPIAQIAMIPVDPTRGQSANRFQVGDKVWLDVTVSEPCMAFLAILDSAGKLAAPDSDQVHTLKPGHPNRLPEKDTAFKLEGAPGTESFLLLLSRTPLDAQQFQAILETTSMALAPMKVDHKAILAHATTLLQRDSRISVAAYTYDLQPSAP
jgi:hypothetical protein